VSDIVRSQTHANVIASRNGGGHGSNGHLDLVCEDPTLLLLNNTSKDDTQAKLIKPNSALTIDLQTMKKLTTAEV